MAAGTAEILDEASTILERSGPIEALLFVDRAIEDYPESAQLRNFRAVALSAQHRLEEAFTELLTARALDPGIAVIHLNLDSISSMLGREDTDGRFFRDYIDSLPKACPYFPSRTRGQYEAVRLSHVAFSEFDGYLERGFRRTGSTLSRYVCPDCLECVQIRIMVQDFDFRKWKRIFRKNAACVYRVAEIPFPGTEHVELLSHYLKSRHGWKGPSFTNEAQELHFGFENVKMLETRLDGKLIAVALVDEGFDSLYAAASYYDPGLGERSLGTLNVLSMIWYGKSRDKKYLFMGEAIDSLPNMSYKKRFRPWQYLAVDGTWKDENA